MTNRATSQLPERSGTVNLLMRFSTSGLVVLLIALLAAEDTCVDVESAAAALVAKHQSEALESATRRCLAADGGPDSATSVLRANIESRVCPQKWAVT